MEDGMTAVETADDVPGPSGLLIQWSDLVCIIATSVVLSLSLIEQTCHNWLWLKLKLDKYPMSCHMPNQLICTHAGSNPDPGHGLAVAGHLTATAAAGGNAGMQQLLNGVTATAVASGPRAGLAAGMQMPGLPVPQVAAQDELPFAIIYSVSKTAQLPHSECLVM